MKKSMMLTTVLISMALVSFAQVKLGVQAGVTVSSPTIKGAANLKNVSQPSFGFVAQANVGSLLFRPSINFFKGGYNSTEVSTVGTVTTTEEEILTTKNLQIPLDLVLPIKLNKGRLLLSAAPVVTIGLDAVVDFTSRIQVGNNAPMVSTVNADLDYGDESDEIKRIDWGGSFGVGYEFKKFQINAAYKYGFTDLFNNSENFKNHNITFTLAYFLTGNK
jgi:hypothetical protein